jgi:MFS family permease
VEGTTTEAVLNLRLPWHAGLQPMHWRVLIASFLGWIFDGFESFALFLVLPTMLKALLTPGQLAAAPIWAGITIAGTLFGWGIGGLMGGVLADYVGRKRIMLWSVFLYAAFSGLTAFSTGIWSLLILRCVTGMAMGSEWGTGVSLIAETWPDRARAIGCGFLQSGFGWGTLLAVLVWMLLDAWSPLGPETWRLMFVVGAVPALFVLYIRRNIDESRKWLAAVREQRWQATEGGTAQHGARPFPLSEIFREPQSRKLVLLTLILSLAATISWWAVANLLDRYAASVAAAAGYSHPVRWGTWASLVYTVGGTLGFAVSGFIANAWGRRRFIAFAFAGSLIIVPITYLWVRSPELVVASAFLNGFFTMGATFAWMPIYLPELFTASVRATSIGFIFNATRLVACFFPILAGSMIQFLGGIPHTAAILGLFYVLGLIIPWFLPETAGRRLPE